ncbi:TPA: hypothetical protein IAB95_06270 [Candidatus Ventrenecus avicola]|nr:hypothetical protein [Candidatus Ventrenecus avicola]
MKSKYFLVVNYHKKADTLFLDDVHTPYADISDIDLLTMNMTREEVLESAKIDAEKAQDCDIYITRVRERANHTYELKFYECIFKSPGISISDLALERHNRVYHNLFKEKGEAKQSIEVKDALEFERIAHFLLDGLLGNSTFLYSIIQRKSFLNDHFMNLLRELSLPSNYNSMNYYNYIYPQLLNELKSYKQIRGLFLEYKYFKKQLQREKKTNRFHSLYSSRIFDYSDFFYITWDNANHDPQKHFFTEHLTQYPTLSQDLQLYAKIDKIKREPFQNKELEHWYFSGGTTAILENMDANDIYSCSMEDLLRASIISEQDYLDYLRAKQKQETRKY